VKASPQSAKKARRGCVSPASRNLLFNIEFVPNVDSSFRVCINESK